MKISEALYSKLDKIKSRYDFLGAELSKAEVVSNQNDFKVLGKERSDLEPIVEKYDEHLENKAQYEGCEEMLASEQDADLRAMIKSEMNELYEKLEQDGQELKILLLPKDPTDDNNVIMEIRAGAGGEEASLFGLELMRMYYHYADICRWKIEEISMNMTELGGVKEVVFMIAGKGAYGKLRFESGVHRVQRVPETESQGRIHTSTVTVAVLPEVEDVQVDIKESDIKVDTFRSSGAGGQKVNKTESAIRMTHLPTGLVVECQDERSQTKNREKALKVLKSRLYDYYKTLSEKEYAQERKSQVGTGDRSERIRTYNFPQGRVTDHRIGFTLYALDKFMLGDLDEMISALQIAVQNSLLENIDD